jgi:ABC-type antimicrobial peptide transport system permease subunit
VATATPNVKIVKILWPAIWLALTAAASAQLVPGILISRQLSERAHLAVGDVVSLAANQSGDRVARFRVEGIYEPTPDPMKFNLERLEARLHLPDLMALTSNADDPQSSESVSAVNVAVASSADLKSVASDLSSRSIGLVVTPTARSRGSDTFVVLDRFHTAIAAVTVIGSTAFLLALMVIRAEERREVVGILRLIGISSKSILLEVIIEGAVVAAIGAVFGLLLARVSQVAINRFFQARYETNLVFVSVTPSIAWRCLVVAIPIGALAGAAASANLLRRKPATLIGR